MLKNSKEILKSSLFKTHWTCALNDELETWKTFTTYKRTINMTMQINAVRWMRVVYLFVCHLICWHFETFTQSILYTHWYSVIISIITSSHVHLFSRLQSHSNSFHLQMTTIFRITHIIKLYGIVSNLNLCGNFNRWIIDGSAKFDKMSAHEMMKCVSNKDCTQTVSESLYYVCYCCCMQKQIW